jgi:hypothetical protein
MRLLNVAVPLLSFFVTAALQVLIPQVLQMRLSGAAYAAFVVVSSVAGYIGMADGGLWLPILRELTALNGRRALRQYVGELRRSNRIYVFASAAGLLLGLGSFVAARPALSVAWEPAKGMDFLLASAVTLLAVALRFWSSSYYIALLSSTGRYVFGQLVSIFNQVVPAGVLVTALLLSSDLVLSLWYYAASIGVQGVLEAVVAYNEYYRHYAAVAAEPPPRRLREMVSDGLAIRIGEQLVLFGLPYALSILAVGLVPAAIPARTLSNAARLVSQQFVSQLSLRVTRLVAQAGEGTEQADREYQVAAELLSSGHLGLLAMVDLIAEPVFRVWLPNVAPTIRGFLPGLFAEQALLSAVLPTSMLFMAHGRLRAWGLSKLWGSVFAVGALLAALRLDALGAFGVANFASALPSFVLCAWAELGRAQGFPAVSRMAQWRYFRAAVLVGAYLFGQSPRIVPWLIVLTCLPSFIRSLLVARSMLFGGGHRGGK